MINQFLRINKAKQRNIKAVELWNIRYEYLWDVYDHVWENELKYVKDFFNKNEFEKFCQLNDKFKFMTSHDEPFIAISKSKIDKRIQVLNLLKI